jgi:small subunit ribosomal protein S10
VIKVWDTDRSVVDLWLRYLKRNGIGGVGMKAYVHEFEEFGFGSKEIADLAKQMERPGQDVEQIAEELVQSLSADAAAAAAAATESQGKIEGSTAPAGGEGEVVTDLQGKELVEGPDDVVAGAELPAAHPESEAAEKPKSQPPLKDGGEPAKS